MPDFHRDYLNEIAPKCPYCKEIDWRAWKPILEADEEEIEVECEHCKEKYTARVFTYFRFLTYWRD